MWISATLRSDRSSIECAGVPRVWHSKASQLDVDSEPNWNETNERDDDRTHNIVNELTARDTDDNGSDDFTLTYDGGRGTELS